MVVTGDRDAFQLIDDRSCVKVMATARGITDTKIYDRQAVIDRYGIAARADPRLLRPEGRHLRQHPGRPGHRRQDRRRAAAALRLARGGPRPHRRHLGRQAQGEPRRARRRRALSQASWRRSSATSRSRIDPVAEAAREPDRSRLREVFREFELRDPLRRLEEAFGEGDDAAPAPVAEVTVKARVRAGSLADVAGFERGKEVTIAVVAPETPEGAARADRHPLALRRGGRRARAGRRLRRPRSARRRARRPARRGP